MADNVGYTPGSGATIAADDIGAGVLVQRVKVTHGVDGTATDVSAAAPLPAAGYGLCAETGGQVEVLVDSSGRIVPMLDSIRYLLEALVSRSGFADGAGSLRVNLAGYSSATQVTVTQGTAASTAWPVVITPTFGPGTALDQMYASQTAYDTLRAKVTVS